MIVRDKLIEKYNIDFQISGKISIKGISVTKAKVRSNKPGFVFATSIYQDEIVVAYSYKLPVNKLRVLEGEFTIITDTYDNIIPFKFSFYEDRPLENFSLDIDKLTLEDFSKKEFGDALEDGTKEKILWEIYSTSYTDKDAIKEFLIAIDRLNREEEVKPSIAISHKKTDKKKQVYIAIERGVFNYYAGKISKPEVLDILTKNLQRLKLEEENEFRTKIIELIWAYILDDRFKLDFIMDNIKSFINESDNEFYSIYLYFLSLNTKNIQELSLIANKMNIISRQSLFGVSHWLHHRVMAEIDSNVNEQYRRIKSIIATDINSPFVYLELLRYIEKFDTALLSLDREDIRALYWANKKGILKNSTKDYIVDHAFVVATFNKQLVALLISFYNERGDKKLLLLICSLLIRGNVKNAFSFYWFEKGVNEKLLITSLNEYLLSSMPIGYEKQLPVSIYMYFKDNKFLSDDDYQKLYVNILANKEELQDIYKHYKASMEAYAIKNLSKRIVNDSLAIIYNSFPLSAMLDKALSHCLLNIFCAYSFEVEDDNVIRLIILQERLSNTIDVWIKNRTGVNRIPDSKFDIIMVMKDGRKVFDKNGKVKYRRIMPLNKDVELAFKLGKSHIVALMENRNPDRSTYEALNQKRWLREGFHRNIQRKLFDIYKNEGCLLENVKTIKLAYMEDKKTLIEAFISAKEYKLALRGFISEGFDVVDAEYKKILLKGLISEGALESKLTHDIAVNLFLNKADDDFIVKYLYAQSLLTIDEEVKYSSVLRNKFEQDNNILTKLDYLSIDLLRENGTFIEESFYNILWESRYKLSIVSLLELLRKLAYEKYLDIEKQEFILAELRELVKADIYLGWFIAFKRYGILPSCLSDKAILTFDRGHSIRYRYCTIDDAYRVLELKKIVDGLYVVGISMFYGDKLEYVILDINGKELTEKLEYTHLVTNSNDGYTDGYDMINEILYARANKKESLQKKISGYKQMKIMSRKVFKPRI